MSCLPTIGTLVGARIRERRHELGMSQFRLCCLTGMSRPAISRLEVGKHTPSLSTLDRLADALGTTIMDLVAPIDGQRRCDPPDPTLTVDIETGGEGDDGD